MGTVKLMVNYPLTLPRVKPDTNHRLRARNRTTTGIITIREAAPYIPHWTLILASNDFKPKGRVHSAESWRIWAATRYSDHAVMNENNAVITSAGAASGKMIL